ncbi:MAG: type II toxin-antitoxin system prevent-host-death family antitoxin [Planctomycetes bacterium]|nr:type II toxin-antitoxin system prevent-host-death family antitoxin [Planctomycetota bacterium]
MTRRCSVADARNRLPELLRKVEAGEAVAITRRGRPVAALVSLPSFRARSGERGAFSAAYRAWRATVDPRDLGFPRGHVRRLRDRSRGRRVSL